jgi:hypothetical protein
MQSFYRRSLQTAASLTIGILAATSFVFAQESYPPLPPQQQTASTGGWKRVGDGQTPNPNSDPQAAYSQQPSYPANQPSYSQQPAYPPANQPVYGPAPYNQGTYPPQGSYPPPQNQQPPASVPAQLTMPAGTFVTVRVNQYLSSDRNQPGDAFSATLVQPVVVNGVVVAEPGQTIAGRVTEAQKAGRVEGTARLGVQLTELTLVDGQQIPIQSQFISRQGPTSVGRDAGAIATTTAIGAAIGAAAGWGTGAAIGAGAGAAAGTIGVLLTRGQPSVIAPEQVLTFRIEAPVTIATDRAPQAFRYVQPNEYDRPIYNQPAPQVPYAAPAPVFPPYYAYGYGYPYYYPYYYGPSFSFFVGRGFYYGRPYYYGRGYYGVYRR